MDKALTGSMSFVVEAEVHHKVIKKPYDILNNEKDFDLQFLLGGLRPPTPQSSGDTKAGEAVGHLHPISLLDPLVNRCLTGNCFLERDLLRKRCSV